MSSTINKLTDPSLLNISFEFLKQQEEEGFLHIESSSSGKNNEILKVTRFDHGQCTFRKLVSSSAQSSTDKTVSTKLSSTPAKLPNSVNGVYVNLENQRCALLAIQIKNIFTQAPLSLNSCYVTRVDSEEDVMLCYSDVFKIVTSKNVIVLGNNLRLRDIEAVNLYCIASTSGEDQSFTIFNSTIHGDLVTDRIAMVFTNTKVLGNVTFQGDHSSSYKRQLTLDDQSSVSGEISGCIVHKKQKSIK